MPRALPDFGSRGSGSAIGRRRAPPPRTTRPLRPMFGISRSHDVSLSFEIRHFDVADVRMKPQAFRSNLLDDGIGEPRPRTISTGRETGMRNQVIVVA